MGFGRNKNSNQFTVVTAADGTTIEKRIINRKCLVDCEGRDVSTKPDGIVNTSTGLIDTATGRAVTIKITILP